MSGDNQEILSGFSITCSVWTNIDNVKTARAPELFDIEALRNCTAIRSLPTAQEHVSSITLKEATVNARAKRAMLEGHEIGRSQWIVIS
jgi:hypothetical protein